GASLREVLFFADRQRRGFVAPGLELRDDRGFLALLGRHDRGHAREIRHPRRLAVVGLSGLPALGGTAGDDQYGERERRRAHYFLRSWGWLQSSPTRPCSRRAPPSASGASSPARLPAPRRWRPPPAAPERSPHYAVAPAGFAWVSSLFSRLGSAGTTVR